MRLAGQPPADMSGKERQRARGPPLGAYIGVEPVADIILVTLGGTLMPFSEEQFLERYPTHRAYVVAVAHGARPAFRKRYISRRDQEEYIRIVRESVICTREP